MHPFQCETVNSDRISGFAREAFIWRCNGPAPSLHSPSPFGRWLGRGSKANTALVPLPPPLLRTGEGGKHPSFISPSPFGRGLGRGSSFSSNRDLRHCSLLYW